jgi:hypothetical protein
MRKTLTVFQQALVDSVLKEYTDVPDEKDIPNVFSVKFQNWTENFQKRNGTKRLRTITVMKRILIAALIAVLLASAAMAIPAVREAVIDFFFHEDDTRIGITFDPMQAATAPKEILSPYNIAYVTDSYILVSEGVERGYVYAWFVNNNEEWITFIQSVLPEDVEAGTWWGHNVKESKRRTVLMGDYLVEVIDGVGNYKLVWTNNEYLFTLELPYSIDEEEMQKIFASWGPKE